MEIPVNMGLLRINLGPKDFFPLFITPDSRRLFAGSRSGRLKVCDLQAAGAIEVIKDQEHPILGAAPFVRGRSEDPEGCDAMQSVAVLLEGGLVKLIDLTTYKPVDTDFLHVGQHAERLAFSQDGKRMAVGYKGRAGNPQIAVFSSCTRAKLQELNGAKCWCNCEQVAFSPDGRHIIGISDNWLAVWDAKGKLVKEDDTEDTMTPHSESSSTDIAVTPDSSKLIWLQATRTGYCVKVSDLKNYGDGVWELEDWGPRAIDISRDGSQLIVAAYLAEFRREGIYEWSIRAPYGRIREHSSFCMIAEVQ